MRLQVMYLVPMRRAGLVASEGDTWELVERGSLEVEVCSVQWPSTYLSAVTCRVHKILVEKTDPASWILTSSSFYRCCHCVQATSWHMRQRAGVRLDYSSIWTS